MTHVKICGIGEEIHALAAAEAGADFIGLVFARSSRRVTPTQAEKIAAAVRKSGHSAQIVGVFANIPAYLVDRIAIFCHLDWVQLSGDESWEYCTRIVQPIIKAVRVHERQRPDRICVDLAAGAKVLKQKQYMYLLDTQVKGKHGGTGITFDWSLAKPVAEQFPVIIAGGLTPENVAQAIEIVAPWGVDVSSGVETNGAKDIAKIKAFIEAVRRADDG